MSELFLVNEWSFWAATGDDKLIWVCDVIANTKEDAAVKFHEQTNNKYNDGDSWICSFQKYEEKE